MRAQPTWDKSPRAAHLGAFDPLDLDPLDQDPLHQDLLDQDLPMVPRRDVTGWLP
jgi:hypothetical protein